VRGRYGAYGGQYVPETIMPALEELERGFFQALADTQKAIFAVGLFVPSITVPVQDANTGQIVDQTLNIRPYLAIVAFFAIVFYAVIVWLITYGVARAIVLIVVVLGALVAVSRLGTEPPTAVAASVVSLLCDAGFAYVLTMTFLAPRRRSQSAGSGLPS